MKRDKPMLNQVLYSLNVGNAARNREQVLTEVKVVKVGRKYFTCCPLECENRTWMHTQFYLDDWRQKTEYTADTVLYESKEAYESEYASMRIYKKIRMVFDPIRGNNNISLASLKKIESIIDAESD